MPAIEVERQMLPMLGEPESGRAVLQPRPAADRAVRARPPHLRRLRAVHPVPDDEQGVGRQHDPGRTDRVHVRREQLVSVHAATTCRGRTRRSAAPAASPPASRPPTRR